MIIVNRQKIYVRNATLILREKNNFEVSKNLAGYKSENNFVGQLK